MNPDTESSGPEARSRTVRIESVTRVEGEGALTIRTEGSRVAEVSLNIFEPPRFFEALLRGRSFTEAPDITSRICGICPVAYQMSAVHALEDGLQLEVPETVRQLRRLLYCGEWIESHTLHIYLLHAPDFLGYPDAVSLARAQRSRVELGLRLKKVGNRIMSVLGGREIHPINIKVGGFYHTPTRADLQVLHEELTWSLDAARDTFSWVSGFHFPDETLACEWVALQHPSDYPMNEGCIASSRGLALAASAFEQNFEEFQVPHSTALHARRVGHGTYLTGPLARYQLNFARLPRELQQAACDAGLGKTCENLYRSIQVRALEVWYACGEALRIIDSYQDAGSSAAVAVPRASVGYAATEAPRGLLYHRYEIDGEGLIKSARIVPPTSQNQSHMEGELKAVIARNLELDDTALAALCERYIRNFDPCISCATHFLRLERERL